LPVFILCLLALVRCRLRGPLVSTLFPYTTLFRSFAVVDGFWVSRLGPDAVATVGLTESILTLVYTAAMGLSIGVAAVVARRIGERRPDAASEAAVQGIALGLVVAAVVASLGIALAPRLLAVMGA